MKREDKIKKMKKLRAFKRWLNNVINDEDPCDPDELLGDDRDLSSFIGSSFIWISSPENYDYWKNISEK